MSRVLIIGQNGQVTTYLQRVLVGYDLIVAGRDELDLSEVATIQAKLESMQPDIIVNPAAYTAVDKAEEEVDDAYIINRDAVAEIARYSAKHNVPLVHFSTDYVFAGDADSPYMESDATGPTGVYGASKLAGEQAILTASAPAIILRTAWVYSNHGKNFYNTMLALADSRDELSIVSDQIGAPTYARSIAEGCKQLIDIITHQKAILPEQRGIYHFTCAGQTSWAEFARSLFLENDITSVKVTPIPSKDYPTPAKRPAYSVLSGEKLADVFGIALPHWGTALAQCAAETKSL